VHVVEVMLGVLLVGGADQRRAQPRQREDRPAAAGGHDRAGVERQGLSREDDMGAARGADARDLGLVVKLLGSQAIGPDAGRVHDVARPHREALAGERVADLDAARAPAVVDQVGDLQAVRAHRAEALGLGQHGEHETAVVGLAVVEEVAGGR
jgi:hypothetical protein